jgi:hypothetical protein
LVRKQAQLWKEIVAGEAKGRATGAGHEATSDWAAEGKEEESSDTVPEDKDAPDMTERGDAGALDTAGAAAMEDDKADSAAGDETA